MGHLKLYLLLRPEAKALLLCTAPEKIPAALAACPGATAYLLGTADHCVPPRVLGEFSEVYPILTNNAEQVTTEDKP